MKTHTTNSQPSTSSLVSSSLPPGPVPALVPPRGDITVPPLNSAVSAESTTRFEAGRTYYTTSVCDHNCIVEVTVISRTAKTIKTSEGKTLRVSEWRGEEQVKPLGSYSMAPIIGARDTVRPLTDWERDAPKVAEVAAEAHRMIALGSPVGLAVMIAGESAGSSITAQAAGVVMGQVLASST